MRKRKRQLNARRDNIAKLMMLFGPPKNLYTGDEVIAFNDAVVKINWGRHGAPSINKYGKEYAAMKKALAHASLSVQ